MHHHCILSVFRCNAHYKLWSFYAISKSNDALTLVILHSPLLTPGPHLEGKHTALPKVNTRGQERTIFLPGCPYRWIQPVILLFTKHDTIINLIILTTLISIRFIWVVRKAKQKKCIFSDFLLMETQNWLTETIPSTTCHTTCNTTYFLFLVLHPDFVHYHGDTEKRF